MIGLVSENSLGPFSGDLNHLSHSDILVTLNNECCGSPRVEKGLLIDHPMSGARLLSGCCGQPATNRAAALLNHCQ